MTSSTKPKDKGVSRLIANHLSPQNTFTLTQGEGALVITGINIGQGNSAILQASDKGKLQMGSSPRD